MRCALVREIEIEIDGGKRRGGVRPRSSAPRSPSSSSRGARGVEPEPDVAAKSRVARNHAGAGEPGSAAKGEPCTRATGAVQC